MSWLLIWIIAIGTCSLCWVIGFHAGDASNNRHWLLRLQRVRIVVRMEPQAIQLINVDVLTAARMTVLHGSTKLHDEQTVLQGPISVGLEGGEVLVR